jgi:predicted hydrocarbon binding protein
MKTRQEWNPAAEANLKKQWVDYGRELGKRMVAMLGNELDITYGVLEDSARDAGWGILKIEGDKRYGTHLNFKLSNCVFCDGLEGRFKEPCCYELAGTIQGVVEAIHGLRIAKEVKCASQVWDVCEIEVSR